MKTLEGKVAIVTGGSSGIGKACVELFLSGGAKVIIADLNEDLGQKLADELGENTLFVKADASSAEDNKMLVDKAIEKFGALHIAVNNAGIGGESNKVADLSLEGWKEVIDIKINGGLYRLNYQITAIKQVGGNIENKTV